LPALKRYVESGRALQAALGGVPGGQGSGPARPRSRLPPKAAACRV